MRSLHKQLWQLNKVTKNKQEPLPIIINILLKYIGYTCFSKLDISMLDYTFKLDDESQDLCTRCTQFGMYKHARLPMGLKCTLDFAQATMEKMLHGIDDADIHINDVVAFSDDWKSHIKLLDVILCRLRENWTHY